MKLTVLTDNNTYFGDHFYGEPGLSFYIEEEDNRILFDMGYSDIFIRNGMNLGIRVQDVSHILFSHGHLDHTWGLSHFMESVKPSIVKEMTTCWTIPHWHINPRMVW